MARPTARSAWAGVLTGAGAFQLYDGTVQHKLLGLQQIRYAVDLTPYDWTWNIVAVLLSNRRTGVPRTAGS